MFGPAPNADEDVIHCSLDCLSAHAVHPVGAFFLLGCGRMLCIPVVRFCFNIELRFPLYPLLRHLRRSRSKICAFHMLCLHTFFVSSCLFFHIFCSPSSSFPHRCLSAPMSCFHLFPARCAFRAPHPKKRKKIPLHLLRCLPALSSTSLHLASGNELDSAVEQSLVHLAHCCERDNPFCLQARGRRLLVGLPRVAQQEVVSDTILEGVSGVLKGWRRLGAAASRWTCWISASIRSM